MHQKLAEQLITFGRNVLQLEDFCEMGSLNCKKGTLTRARAKITTYLHNARAYEENTQLLVLENPALAAVKIA
ncbi:hypothetical protein CCR75_001499 [Bremia lactucae]|uniref:Uncharacterized protein n=1 Tax=Bremia lactucae TaxID=4779 RepID=A0A976NYU4_BRELC|nr:hypothetical protein CCR75_001499 [Bremia lactucae]